MGPIELAEAAVDRIEGLRREGHQILSVYLATPTRPVQGVTPRLKQLLRPLQEQAQRLEREAAQAAAHDIDYVLGIGDRIVASSGKGVAVFVCSGADILERVALPASVRDRAVLDARPLVRPLHAMLEELHRYCAVVLDRRRAEIFEFRFGRLEHWEQMNEEELRKVNFGGFGGYAEHGVRAHGDEVAHRHFRETASRIFDLLREDPFDLLLVGGQSESIDGLLAELHPDLRALLAGTFSIDMHTMTPALVEKHCAEVAAAHDSVDQQTLVSRLIDAAKGGGSGVLGLDWVVDAVNQKAVDLLVIDSHGAPAGGQCVECSWLMTEPGETCPACSGSTRRVADLLDASAQAVVDSGGRVRHIFTDTPLAESKVGAMLRFPVAYRAS